MLINNIYLTNDTGIFYFLKSSGKVVIKIKVIKPFVKTKYMVTKNLLIIGALTTGLLSGIIVLLAYFGQNMGNLVIDMEEDAYTQGIILSTSSDFNYASPRLVVNPVTDAECVSYSWLKKEQIMNTDGDYYDPDGLRYIGYTFYLKNEGLETVDVSMKVEISQVYKDVDAAIRFMVIKTDDRQTTENIYQKEDPITQRKYPIDMPKTKNFLTDTTICEEITENFEPNEYIKYSVVIWLEGYDDDCIETIKNGTIRFQMIFKIIEDIEDYIQ